MGNHGRLVITEEKTVTDLFVSLLFHTTMPNKFTEF